MNEPEKDRLLRLYKLLWEQIKEKELFNLGLCLEVEYIDNCLISDEECQQLCSHILDKMPKNDDGTKKPYGWELDEEGTADRKAFVQRMIKELENDK